MQEQQLIKSKKIRLVESCNKLIGTQNYGGFQNQFSKKWVFIMNMGLIENVAKLLQCF